MGCSLIFLKKKNSMGEKYNPEKYFNEVLPAHDKQSAELKAKQQEEIKPQVEAAHEEANEANRLGDVKKMVAEYEAEAILLELGLKSKIDEIVEDIVALVKAKKEYDVQTDNMFSFESTTVFADGKIELDKKWANIVMVLSDQLEQTWVDYEDAAGEDKGVLLKIYVKEKILKNVEMKNGENEGWVLDTVESL